MVFPFLIAKFGAAKAGRDPLAEIRKPGELDADIAAAKQILDAHKEKVILPPVYIVEGRPGCWSTAGVKQGIPARLAIRDVSPIELQTIIGREIGGAKTLIVNGSLGKTPDYFEGTVKLFDWVSSFTDHGMITAIAGGDTNADAKTLRKRGMTINVSVQPSGGGAFLKLLETGTLPVEAFLSQTA